MTQYDKNGQEVQNLVLQSVTVSPCGSYDIFSVTKKMKYLTNLSDSITHFTIIKIIIITIYFINLSFVIFCSEFRLGIALSCYVNVRNLGNGNICSVPSNCK